MAALDDSEATAIFLARQPDFVRWLPALSVNPLRPLACATWDWDTCTARLEGMMLATPSDSDKGGFVKPRSGWSPESPLRDGSGRGQPDAGSAARTVVEWGLPSRCSSNVCVAAAGEGSRQALVIAGTEGGDVVAGLADTWQMSDAHDAASLQEREVGNAPAGPQQGGLQPAGTLAGKGALPAAGQVSALLRSFHRGRVSAVDFQPYSRECLSAGEDGRLRVYRVEGGKGAVEDLGKPDGSDMAGGLAYSCAKWLSPSQVFSATLGAGVKWWDRRHSTSLPAAACPLSWSTIVPGAITSCHTHPSRQHLLVAGGSSGTLIVWDLRSVSSPLLVCGTACRPQLAGDAQATPWPSAASPAPVVSTADVLDVRFDPLLRLDEVQRLRSDSVKLPPLLACSADGALSLLSGGAVTDVFVSSSAVLSFDVEPDFGQHVICALDHECVAYLHRPRWF